MTPVLAFRCGSVPEVITEGVTGFIVGEVEEAVMCVDKLVHLDRAKCRQEFEARFTARRMADNYMKLYEETIERNKGRTAHRSTEWLSPIVRADCVVGPFESLKSL